MRISSFAALLLLLSGCCLPPARQLRTVDHKLDRVLDNQAVMQVDLDELVAASRLQGTGEITLFFPWATGTLWRSSGEYDRLVGWLDNLVLHARGREIVLVAVGSATDWGRPERNQRMSARRARDARAIIERQLVHVPHRWADSYGTGAVEVPPDAGGRTWRHTRVIAVYDEGQLPALPRAPHLGAQPARRE